MKNIILFFIFLSLFVSIGPAIAQTDYGVPLMEGEFIDIAEGYSLNILDVDPYYGQVEDSR